VAEEKSSDGFVNADFRPHDALQIFSSDSVRRQGELKPLDPIFGA
jgi:hypothetical protein